MDSTTSCFDSINDEQKNARYYDGTRFFRVPRHMYPQYTRGYFYGYYESVEYYKNYITQYNND